MQSTMVPSGSVSPPPARLRPKNRTRSESLPFTPLLLWLPWLSPVKLTRALLAPTMSRSDGSSAEAIRFALLPMATAPSEPTRSGA